LLSSDDDGNFGGDRFFLFRPNFFLGLEFDGRLVCFRRVLEGRGAGLGIAVFGSNLRRSFSKFFFLSIAVFDGGRLADFF
jgi:hypothetical protein